MHYLTLDTRVMSLNPSKVSVGDGGEGSGSEGIRLRTRHARLSHQGQGETDKKETAKECTDAGAGNSKKLILI